MKAYIEKIKYELNKEKIVAIVFIIISFGLMISFIINGQKDIKSIFKDTFSNKELSKYEKALNITNKTENIINDNISYKEEFINVYGLIQKIIGRKFIEDKNDSTRDIVKLNNNMITFVQKEQDMSDIAIQIVEFKEKLEKNQIPLLYVQAPYKVRNENDVPVGIKDYANQNADNLLQTLNDNNIDNIDLRESFKNKEIEDEFFYTDHHWNIKTAFEATNIISEKLNEKYNFDIDTYYMNIENYNEIKTKTNFLGSIGKRIGKYYDGTDVFKYLVPNFETKLTVNNIFNKQKIEGSFEETIINKDLLAGKTTIDNKYACYFGGDYPEIIIENQESTSDKKILVIQDSFGLPFSAMMSLRVKELRILDLRHFEENEIDYIEKYNPDIVIILYNPTSFSIEKIFEFK